MKPHCCVGRSVRIYFVLGASKHDGPRGGGLNLSDTRNGQSGECGSGVFERVYYSIFDREIRPLREEGLRLPNYPSLNYWTLFPLSRSCLQKQIFSRCFNIPYFQLIYFFRWVVLP